MLLKILSKPRPLLGATTAFILLLMSTALACNLTSKNGEPTASALLRPMNTAIISPAGNTVFKVNEPITVQASIADPEGTGVTRVELIANNVVVDQKPSQNPQGDKNITVNLSWSSPVIPGTYTLVVRPYRGQTQGTPATVTVIVLDSNIGVTVTSSSGGNPSGGTSGGSVVTSIPPTYNPACRARVDVNRLNYRSSPNSTSDANLIGYYLIGDEAPLVARLGDNSWYQTRAITNPNTIGWIYGPFTTLLGNCSSVPVASAPATVVPTPTQTLQPSAAPKADIVAISPSGPSNLVLGVDGTTTASYTFTIQNTGTVATGTFRALISLADGTQVSQSIPSVQPGAIYSFPAGGLQITFTSPGSQRIFYEADIDLQVSETNEANNLAFLDVNVVSQ